MKSREKIKYIITTIIMAIFIILNVNVVSEAETVTECAFKKSNIGETKDKIGYNQAGLGSASKEKGLFCIEKGHKLNSEGTKYELIDIIHIKGDGTITHDSNNKTITNRKTKAKTAAYALNYSDDTVKFWYTEDGKNYYRSDKAMIIWNYITSFTNSIKEKNNKEEGYKTLNGFDVKGIAKSKMTVSAKKTLAKAKLYASKTESTSDNTKLEITQVGDMTEEYWNNKRYFKVSLQVNCKLEDMYIYSNITGEDVYDDSDIKININAGDYKDIREYYDENYWSNNLAEEIIANKTFDLYIPYDANLKNITIEGIGNTSISGKEITADIAYLKSLNESWQNLIAVKTHSEKVEIGDNTHIIQIERPVGGLQIEKVDADNPNFKMANVGFKVQNVDTGGWVVEDAAGNVSVNGTFDTATEYPTGTDGKTKVINNLLIGNYKPVETKNPYSGYVDTDTNLTINVLPDSIQPITFVTKSNKHLYTSISGYVWNDGEVGKSANMNGTFDYGEGLGGVRVALWYVGKAEPEAIADTDSDGKYEFNNVKVDDLSYLYVDFYYDGITYDTVNPMPSAYQYNADGSRTFIDAVTKGVENSELRKKLNNKFGNITNNTSSQNSIKINDGVTNDALGYSRDTTNHTSTVDYSGIGTTVWARAGAWVGLEGADDVWKSLCNDFSLIGRFNEIKAVDPIVLSGIQNVNLGLKVREKPDISILKDIESIKLSINGYNHIYEYDKRYEKYGENPDGFNVGVKFGNEYGSMAYTRPIYKSDYMYKSSDTSKELQVYINYKIMIYNNTTTLVARSK